MTNSSIGHIWILYWEDYFTLTACGYSLMCESPLYTNKVLRVLKWRGSITTLQTCQDIADHIHLLLFFTMLLHGLHNVKRSLAMWFLLEVQIQRWSSTQKWPEIKISMMIINQHENLSTHVNRNITMPSFHRGWVPDTDVVPSSENRNTFVSFVSSK
jgi:hypothetical protein